MTQQNNGGSDRVRNASRKLLIAGMTGVAVGAVCSVLVVTGCGSSDDDSAKTADGAQTTGANGRSSFPQGSEPVELDPADFTTRIDNPYWPMAPDGKPGKKWVYRTTGGESKERVEVTVTDRKKTVEGVAALVLRDVVSEDGKLVEVTDDWYAQDKEGNIWYLGEDTKEYENGKVVTTSGSWESGVDGAEAGIIMPADPKPGLAYRQEYFEGEAEDNAKVISIDESVKVPAGSFDGCLETEDTTPLEPDVVEHKFYARGVGPVLRTSEGSDSREELVSFSR
jgi:major membrane immunogen (membrane-anchored lipoprotein)